MQQAGPSGANLGSPSRRGDDIEPVALYLGLARLEEQLAGRMAREEGPAGFLAFMCHAAPRYTSLATRLRHDHRHLLSELAKLRARAGRAHADADTLLVELDLIAERIEHHEELEYELLRDALDP